MKPETKPYREWTREERRQAFIEEEQRRDAEKATKHFNPDPWKEIPSLLTFHRGWSLAEIRRMRCPDCYGEVVRWASLYKGNKYWIYFRCSSGHIVRGTHGVVIRCLAFENAVKEHAEEK